MHSCTGRDFCKEMCNIRTVFGIAWTLRFADRRARASPVPCGEQRVNSKQREGKPTPLRILFFVRYGRPMVGTCGAAFRVSWVHTANVRAKPRRWRRLPPCGNSYPPALTQSYSFYYIYKTPYPLFLWERRLKEKANKKKRQRGRRARGGFLKKAPS